MRRIDIFKVSTVEQVADQLCELISSSYDDCRTCPATDTCRKNHTGFIDWLLEDSTTKLEDRIIQETMALIDDGK